MTHPNTNSSFAEEVERILRKNWPFDEDNSDAWDDRAIELATQALNALHEQEVLRIIGEDEPDPKYNGHPNTRRNQLRAEQRAALRQEKYG